MKRFAKKALILLLVLCLLAVCGCGSDKANDTDTKETTPETNAGNETESKKTTTTTAPAIPDNAIDPFEGLVVEFDDISPFCTIAFNNSQCSEKAQLYVEYSVSPTEVTTDGYFKLGDTVTVYASVRHESGPEPDYELTATSKEYTVANVPKYVTELTDDMDLSLLKEKIADYFTEITTFTVGGNAMGRAGYSSHTKPEHGDIYFSALKMHEHSSFNKDRQYFNRIDLFYSTTISWKITNPAYFSGEVDKYFAITVKNLVLYPDGSLGWGQHDPGSLAFEYDYSDTSMKTIVDNNVISAKETYNVFDVKEFLQ